ncbi:MAG TPA: GAF domain-containing protein [Candidatus Aquilonibacter sp.]|nr:GAF domain-containing protein [Candidatus Aquilonibacter sp.]
MSATQQSVQPASVNRRRCVRQKAHAPAYATFPAARKGQMLDLHEVLDISQMGVALQCPSRMEPNQQLDLCLDLAEASGQILTPAKVIWSNSSGRVGLAFSPLQNADLHRLQQWLFLNAMAGAANAASCAELPSLAPQSPGPRPSFTDTLTAVSAVQREAESLGSDLEAVLTLIVCRSRSLLQGSGAAIALAANEPGSIVCRASVGLSAPPVGAELKAGIGFSGDCLRSGQTLRCDDSDTDARVDPQTCRALGIRSMIASPIRGGEKVIGLIEVFSEQPSAFAEKDEVVLQRLAESIAAAVNCPTSGKEVPPPPTVQSFAPPGSVLFAQPPKRRPEPKEDKSETSVDADKVGGIRLPRTHLYLLIFVAATVALALGFILAPWIQEKFQGDERSSSTQTVLASSRPLAESPASSGPSVDAANFDQLLQLAQQGNASAENALGLLYAQGDDKQSVKLDESVAANWFTKAAEHGSSAAQYKLGLLYWGGHGVPKDINKAYFWAVLARAGGQEGSQDLAKVLANGMTRSQATAIEQQAEIWYQQHQIQPKPAAGH